MPFKNGSNPAQIPKIAKNISFAALCDIKFIKCKDGMQIEATLHCQKHSTFVARCF